MELKKNNWIKHNRSALVMTLEKEIQVLDKVLGRGQRIAF